MEKDTIYGEELINFLLRPDVPDVRKNLPEKQIEVKRLSAMAGKPVLFKIKGLPYGQCEALRRMDPESTAVQLIVKGCVDPNFKDERLLHPEKGIVTANDAVKAALNAGEIMEISCEIEKLCGYRQRTIEEVKN